MTTPAAAMAIIRGLIGCDFGIKVCVPGVDDRPCTHKAESYVQLYDNGKPLPPMKFCKGHLAFMETQTTPRPSADADLLEQS